MAHPANNSHNYYTNYQNNNTKINNNNNKNKNDINNHNNDNNNKKNGKVPSIKNISPNKKKETKLSPFEQLMIEYPTYKHCFIDVGLMSANGMSFKHELNSPKYKNNKTQEDIAREKAMMQLQVQCSIKGGEAILGLQFEFTKNDIGICICTAYGTAVKYRR